LTARDRGRKFAGTGDKGTALVMSERQPPDYGSEESVGDRTSEAPAPGTGTTAERAPRPPGSRRSRSSNGWGPEEIGAATQRRLLGAFPRPGHAGAHRSAVAVV